jgi:hypothetical protein
VLAFFNFKGLIYTNYMPKEERSMPRIMLRSHSIPENLKQKRLRWRPGTGGSTETSPCANCHLDDQPMMSMQLKIIKHLPYLQDLATADFFIFPRVQRELDGQIPTQETLMIEWEGTV